MTLKSELVPKLVSELSDVRITIIEHEILDIRFRRPGAFFTMGIVGNVSEQNGPQIPLLCKVLFREEHFHGSIHSDRPEKRCHLYCFKSSSPLF